jgi:ABC-2 type transport system permease protein
MIRLLKLEALKNQTYRTFWILTGLYFLLMGLVTFGLRNFIGNITINGEQVAGMDLATLPFYQFPEIWHNVTYLASFLKFIPAVLVIISISNEYTYRTIRQNIIDGLSRWEFIFSKLLGIIMFSILATLFLIVIVLILGFSNTENISVSQIFQKSEFIPAFFLELVTYLIFALFVGTIIKRSGLAISMLVLYSLVIEPLIGYQLPDNISEYLPMAAVNNLIEMPFTRYFGQEVQESVNLLYMALSFSYAIFFTFITFFYLNQRDL